MKKRGFFLTTDAFIAIAIIVFGVILFISTISGEPYKPQAIFFAQDVVKSLGGTKIYEINDDNSDFAGDISKLETLELVRGPNYVGQHRIDDFQNTIFGQSLVYIYRESEGVGGSINIAKLITKEIVKSLVADEYSINISMSVEDLGQTYTLYHNEHISAGVNHKIDDSDIVFSSKQLVMEQINDTFIGIGIAEVIVWQ